MRVVSTEGRWLRFSVQALLIAPVTLLYLSTFPFGLIYVLRQPWTRTGGTWLDAWVVGSWALGGLGLYALWLCMLREAKEKQATHKIRLALGLVAGALVALVWIVLPFTSIYATPPSSEIWTVPTFGATLAVALRQGLLLARPPRSKADDDARCVEHARA